MTSVSAIIVYQLAVHSCCKCWVCVRSEDTETASKLYRRLIAAFSAFQFV